jgi:hypothetical protein
MRKIRIIDTRDDMDFLNGLEGYAEVNNQGIFTVYFTRGVAPNGIQKTLLLHPEVEDLGRATVRPITEIMYREMPSEFNGIDLFRRVASALERDDIYADTVFRRMRELKERGVINFECVNDSKSLYKKR